MIPGLNLYYADPAQPLTMTGEALDGLDHDLSDVVFMRFAGQGSCEHNQGHGSQQVVSDRKGFTWS